MSDFLGQLAAQRRKFLDGIEANKGDINLEIFEDFYPDQAHFVYELLQNAEDAEASDVTFHLKRDGCLVVHDGKKLFDENDVQSITGIHRSTKRDQKDQIGKFGVGFKSVFVYTSTPYVYSGDFAFRIVQQVLPEPVVRDGQATGKTTFWLPFNNPRKSPEEAFAEVAAGLGALAETTLLFLSSLESISWKVEGQGEGIVMRHRHSPHHYEVLREIGGRKDTSSHFLKFDRQVEELDKHRVAIAYALEFLPGVPGFEPGKPLVARMKVIPATPGHVAVFFPAEKETSNLKFHLHAPFVPELSRASIKETPDNLPLFGQLAALAASSLHEIRRLGLLTQDFLAVLPNAQDTLPERYRCIRDAIIEEMNEEPLTPTHQRKHAPARHLLQARVQLKNLLTDEDLSSLVGNADEPLQWAAGAIRNSRQDYLLGSLAIRRWDIGEFVELLRRKTGGSLLGTVDLQFLAWMAGKPVEWHQQLYAVLLEELKVTGIRNLKSGRIVRIAEGGYKQGHECFFSGEANGRMDGFPYVEPAVYTSGKNREQQENARKCLAELGVREVGEQEQVEMILKRHYTFEADVPSETAYLRHLKRFIRLVEQEPDAASLFGRFHVLRGTGEVWCRPEEIFLDSPYKETGLSAYFGAIGDKDHYPLDEFYLRLPMKKEQIVKFAVAVGAITRLEIIRVSCSGNPEWAFLQDAPGHRETYSGENNDYTIEHLEKLLAEPNVALSKLIWRTMGHHASQKKYLRATYRKNASYPSRTASSRLVHRLRTAAWIPQTDGTFVRPAEASFEELPEGFTIDKGWEWIEAIQFGQDAMRRSQAEQMKQLAAAGLGFRDSESLERARRIAELLSPEEQEAILAEAIRAREFELSDDEPSNPERRAARVAQAAADAPERQSEVRERSVSVARDGVKAEAAPYLIQQYTSDGVMVCQICKKPLPFRLDNGSFYFEKIEFLRELQQHHYQNYLALCPNHAAMFRHANGSKDLMLEMFLEIEGNELDVILAQQNFTIWFTKKHIADLKAVIAQDRRQAEEMDTTPDEAVVDPS
ncbi:sacsin N-terminal ATP-binding-like domain-containing protein [Tautonia rosea]|uniref:sacsin N-terminal ATP-binding-like domain-containing protein n=1 Tax=Tautonia rosea TaxID=2728037 RepID=UPI001475F0BA|nr:hypothetical protein [Tautonia rosea]